MWGENPGPYLGIRNLTIPCGDKILAITPLKKILAIIPGDKNPGHHTFLSRKD